MDQNDVSRVCESAAADAEPPTFQAAVDAAMRGDCAFLQGVPFEILSQQPADEVWVCSHGETRHGDSLLHRCCASKAPLPVIAHLIEVRGLSPQILGHDDQTLIRTAADHEHFEAFEYLVRAQQLPFDEDDAATWAWLAAAHGLLPALRFLVEEAGASPTSARYDHMSPFEAAVYGGHYEAVVYLGRNVVVTANLTPVETVVTVLNAAAGGHLDIVRFLCLDLGFSADAPHWANQTALMLAAQEGSLEMARCLLDCGAHVDDKAGSDISAVMLATFHGHLEMIKLLVARGANPFQTEVDGATLVYIAANEGFVEIVQYLVEELKLNPEAARESGIRPLYAACHRGHMDTVRYLVLVAGVDMNACCDGRVTSLYIASQENHPDVVRFLLDRSKVAIDRATNTEATPLFVACQNNALEVARLLIMYGADPNKANLSQATPLYIASQNGHIDCVKLLVEQAKADPAKPRFTGETPVYAASSLGHEAVVRYLGGLSAVDLHRPTKTGCTPFLAACERGHLSIARLIAEDSRFSGPGVTQFGNTALHFACQNGHQDVVAYLLQHLRLDPNCVNSESATPVYLAALRGHTRIVQLLYETANADLELAPHGRMTVVRIACYRGHLDMVRYLYEHTNTDWGKLSVLGDSALDDAISGMRVDVVMYLIDVVRVAPTKRTLDTAASKSADILRYLVDKGLVDWRLVCQTQIVSEMQLELLELRRHRFFPGDFLRVPRDIRSAVFAVLLAARGRPVHRRSDRLAAPISPARAALGVLPFDLLLRLFESIYVCYTHYVHPHPLTSRSRAIRCDCCFRSCASGYACAQQCDFQLCFACGKGLGPLVLTGP
jgi:ankyrin repeat protein